MSNSTKLTLTPTHALPSPLPLHPCPSSCRCAGRGYTAQGLLMESRPRSVYECNKRCPGRVRVQATVNEGRCFQCSTPQPQLGGKGSTRIQAPIMPPPIIPPHHTPPRPWPSGTAPCIDVASPSEVPGHNPNPDHNGITTILPITPP